MIYITKRQNGMCCMGNMSRHLTQEMIDARFPDNRRAGKADNVEAPVRVDNWPVKARK